MCWPNGTETKVQKGKDYFQSLKYWKLSPVFTLNYFSMSNDSLKMACLKLCYITNFCTLRHMVCSSYQSSLAVVRNVNLNYLCNGPTRVLNPSLFDYIINTKNSLVSRKSLISLMYITSHLKTLINVFWTKSNIYTWEIFYNSLWSIFTNFVTKEIFINFLCP